MSVPTTAVILAAGCGKRLRDVLDDRPKGLIPLGRTTPVGRSVGLLGQRGFERVIIVAGHLAHWYHEFAIDHPVVHVVENQDYARTGSMASLRCALDLVHEDFLLVESDLVFEDRAIDLLLAHPSPDVLLASGPTRAGDEVWVEAPGSRLSRMSKSREALTSTVGELVGLTRLSADTGAAMRAAYDRFVAVMGHGRMDYETDALVEVGAVRPIDVLLVPDLLWGEIDDRSQYLRVRDSVLPAILGREAAAGSTLTGAP